MGKILKGVGALAVVGLLCAGAWLWTPGGDKIDQTAIRDTAKTYDARILRDNWGVAHIFGKTDADTSFGLAYAHAEDDWDTIQQTLIAARGMTAQHQGKDSAPTDYLFDLFKVREFVAAKYESELGADTQAIAKAYADGINLFGVEQPNRVAKGLLPVTEQDVIAGFTWATPFFYRMDSVLGELFAAEDAPKVSPWGESHNQHGMPEAVRGSNGFAVAPKRSDDGHTRLIVNSHQPFNGPYAWYEAHVVSGEGLNLAGAGFPGTPILTQGITPTHGWTHTVNQPDLVDVYALDVDNEDAPKQYRLDGEWVDFERSTSEFRVKLVGPFSLPIKRDVLWTAHGPVLSTPSGHYAIKFSGLGEVRQLEQWYHMSKADSLTKWKAALAENGVLSFNIVYANKDGDIGHIYNARMPRRIEGPDWGEILPGDKSELIWDDFVPISELPQLWNPDTGWVFSANSHPFMITDSEENQSRPDFSKTFGIEPRVTNRAMRAMTLIEPDKSISEAELLTYRSDAQYHPDFRLRTMLDALATQDLGNDSDILAAQAVLRAWDGSARADSNGAALAIMTGARAYGGEFIDNLMEPEEAFLEVVSEMMSIFGKVDPLWGDVSRLQRGEVDLPLNGGPDTLRAIYPDPAGLEETKTMNAAAGDSHIMYADWDENGDVIVRSIHQYGAATLDKTSPHYDDQAKMFANEQYKIMPMTLEDVLKVAKRDYRPGQ